MNSLYCFLKGVKRCILLASLFFRFMVGDSKQKKGLIFSIIQVKYLYNYFVILNSKLEKETRNHCIEEKKLKLALTWESNVNLSWTLKTNRNTAVFKNPFLKVKTIVFNFCNVHVHKRTKKINIERTVFSFYRFYVMYRTFWIFFFLKKTKVRKITERK